MSSQETTPHPSDEPDSGEPSGAESTAISAPTSLSTGQSGDGVERGSPVWPPRRVPPPARSSYAALELTVSERTWLRRACKERRLPELLPDPQQVTVPPYRYWLCWDPILSHSHGRNMPKFWRDCQIVYPLEITEGMRPFITHPSTHLPVAVIPRARDDDLHCEFCKPLPQLADIRHLCSFHLVYILGPRYSEEFALAGGIINVPGGGIRFSRPGAVGNTIRTMRDLVFGSTAEPRDDEEVLENQRRATRGDFGHVGQGRPAPSHAANSPTT